MPRVTSSAATSDADGVGEPRPLDHRLDLAPVRAGDDRDGDAARRVPDGLADARRGTVDPSAARTYRSIALLDERLELVALDAEPAADDRLLGVARQPAVVVRLGERPAVLGEELRVDRVEDGLVARERPVEVEDAARG